MCVRVCASWLVCLWVLVVCKPMCEVVSSYVCSVFFTVNEVAMTNGRLCVLFAYTTVHVDACAVCCVHGWECM